MNKRSDQLARDIVAMLFWQWRKILAIADKTNPLSSDIYIVEAQEAVAYSAFMTSRNTYYAKR